MLPTGCHNETNRCCGFNNGIVDGGLMPMIGEGGRGTPPHKHCNQLTVTFIMVER